jgi:hypothetical protein
MIVALFRTLVLMALGLVRAVGVVANPIHRPTEPTSEHVTQFAFSARLLQCERRVTERDACLAGRMIHLLKGEQPPTSLRQPSQIVLEHCQPTQPMRFGFMLTPKVGRMVAGPVQDFSIPLAAECSLNGSVVVDEKMAGHVKQAGDAWTMNLVEAVLRQSPLTNGIDKGDVWNGVVG